MNSHIIANPTIDIATDTLESMEELTCEESQVVLHCVYSAPTPRRIRIQPTTYLVDRSSRHRSELVHTENIIVAPEWQEVPAHRNAYFSLIFTGLPKSCILFDLVELNEISPFEAHNINRNNQDVYFIRLN